MSKIHHLTNSLFGNSINRYEKIRKIIEIIAVYSTVKNIYLDSKTWWLTRKKEWFITFSLDDKFVKALGKELMDKMVPGKRYLNLESDRERFLIAFRPEFSHKFILDGRSYLFSVDKESAPTRRVDSDGYGENVLSPSYVRLSANNEEDFKYLKEWLDKLRREFYSQDFKPQIMIGTRWDDWRTSKDLPPRKLDTIFLKEGQKESIVDDLQLFLDSEEQYKKFGIPYHRGYLFYGPPGVGKSSLVTGLANHFNKNLCSLSLAFLNSNVSIERLISEIPANSFLLIEDIDGSDAAQSRETGRVVDKDKATLSTLLNALDGVGTPSGLIVFLTTNYKESLDKALIRPGRIDVLEELSYMDNYQFDNLVSFFLETKYNVDVDVSNLKFTPAEILELIKRNMYDKDMFVKDLNALLKMKEALS